MISLLKSLSEMKKVTKEAEEIEKEGWLDATLAKAGLMLGERWAHVEDCWPTMNITIGSTFRFGTQQSLCITYPISANTKHSPKVGSMLL